MDGWEGREGKGKGLDRGTVGRDSRIKVLKGKGKERKRKKEYPIVLSNYLHYIADIADQ